MEEDDPAKGKILDLIAVNYPAVTEPGVQEYSGSPSEGKGYSLKKSKESCPKCFKRGQGTFLRKQAAFWAGLISYSP